MRKLSTIIITLLLVAGLTNKAQAQLPVDFGIKGGINLANIISDDDLDSLIGFHGGLVLDISLPALPIGIESGIYYSQKGAEITEGSFTGTGRLNYIEVPVMAKFSFGPPGPISPHFVIGPYAAYNVKAEFEITDGTSTFTEDFSDEITDLDFGGTIGIGTDFNVGLTKLNVQARYSRGFVDINDNGFEEDREYNSVFSISAGIMF